MLIILMKIVVLSYNQICSQTLFLLKKKKTNNITIIKYK